MEGNAIMKATGIVRRIDDLGRIVIPKEIRRTLRIRESDPLEIFTDREGEIVLKKYSPLGELSHYAVWCAESMANASACGVMITDCDQKIAGAGGKRDKVNKHISQELSELISGRKTIKGEDKPIKLADGDGELRSEAIVPIISEGDVIGAVALISKEESRILGDVEYKIALTMAGFLGRQMEN